MTMLPKLNDTPKYQLTIPSSGKKVKYRPYLVKEEKILLTAVEMGDFTMMINAIVDTIKACVQEDVKFEDLATFDIEYMFLKIRGKSVGENINVNGTCTKCETKNEVSINIDDIQVKMVKQEKKVQLTDKISLLLKYPSYKDVATSSATASTDGDQQNLNFMFDMSLNAIDSIQTENENIKASDVEFAELKDFVESMSTAQYSKIANFIADMPSLKHEVKFKCTSCEADNMIVLEGISDFF